MGIFAGGQLSEAAAVDFDEIDPAAGFEVVEAARRVRVPWGWRGCRDDV